MALLVTLAIGLRSPTGQFEEGAAAAVITYAFLMFFASIASFDLLGSSGGLLVYFMNSERRAYYKARKELAGDVKPEDIELIAGFSTDYAWGIIVVAALSFVAIVSAGVSTKVQLPQAFAVAGLVVSAFVMVVGLLLLKFPLKQLWFTRHALHTRQHCIPFHFIDTARIQKVDDSQLFIAISLNDAGFAKYRGMSKFLTESRVGADVAILVNAMNFGINAEFDDVGAVVQESCIEPDMGSETQKINLVFR